MIANTYLSHLLPVAPRARHRHLPSESHNLVWEEHLQSESNRKKTQSLKNQLAIIKVTMCKGKRPHMMLSLVFFHLVFTLHRH